VFITREPRNAAGNRYGALWRTGKNQPGNCNILTATNTTAGRSTGTARSASPTGAAARSASAIAGAASATARASGPAATAAADQGLRNGRRIHRRRQQHCHCWRYDDCELTCGGQESATIRAFLRTDFMLCHAIVSYSIIPRHTGEKELIEYCEVPLKYEM
jgi:hypothetical protein